MEVRFLKDTVKLLSFTRFVTEYFIANKKVYIIIFSEVDFINKQQIEGLRQKHINNPPKGMPKKDIRKMSYDDLLDMDYFINEDEDYIFFSEDTEGFFIF